MGFMRQKPNLCKNKWSLESTVYDYDYTNENTFSSCLFFWKDFVLLPRVPVSSPCWWLPVKRQPGVWPLHRWCCCSSHPGLLTAMIDRFIEWVYLLTPSTTVQSAVGRWLKGWKGSEHLFEEQPESDPSPSRRSADTLREPEHLHPPASELVFLRFRADLMWRSWTSRRSFRQDGRHWVRSTFRQGCILVLWLLLTDNEKTEQMLKLYLWISL